MECKWMNEYLCKSTTRFRKYNKMDANNGVMSMETMMKVMTKPPMILVAARMDARMQVPPPDIFRRCGFCVFWCLWRSDL